ncbi:MAG: hypothetical protein N2037_05080 [Acidimicrobiales bacterium]|nr:hypothetical protein [Acidimicrobiales bacterium]
MTRAFDDLADRLDAISEELADLALAQLRNALDGDNAGSDEAVTIEKRLIRARRAVVKASGLLRGVGDGG